ncbi:hypothetical protein ACLVWU_11905 [Bdellovibrio sp. HCB290]|uniref:hypothetical protein n=1 Tax=Bdellovibrio sp. HCB290 TaxID=3394356 RepID=UPI0039B4F974
MKQAFLSLLISAFSLTALAQMGPSNGGGGDVVVLPNDQVVLADPFLNHDGQQPNNMPPMRSINPRIIQAILQYGKFSAETLKRLSNGEYAILKQMELLINPKESELRFYAVQSAQELANFCAPGGKKSYNLPDGASVQSVACTAGHETFLVEPLFLRLTIRDQAMLLIHERLTTLRDKNGGKNYSAIARFTTGLKTFISVGQDQVKGVVRRLTEGEVQRLTDFYVAAEEIERRNGDIEETSFTYQAHPYGGGMIAASAQVASSAYVDLQSQIAGGSYVGAGAILRNFNFVSNWAGAPSKVEVQPGVQAQNVKIYCEYNGPCIRNFVIGQNTYLNNVVMEVNEQTRIASGQRLSNAAVDHEAKEYAPIGYKLKEMNSENSVACPTDGQYWGSDEDRIEIFTTKLVGKEKVFGRDWKYSKCSVKIHTTNSLSPKAPGNMYGLNSNGILYKAGVKIRYRMEEAGYPAMLNFLRSQGFGVGRDNQGLYIDAPVVKE